MAVTHYDFAGKAAVFANDHFTYNGETIRYKDIVMVKNHHSKGYFQFILIRTDTSILQTIIKLKNGRTIILEQKGFSFWGIGTNGVTKRKWRDMSETLKQYVAPYIAARYAKDIQEKGYINLYDMFRIDKTGVTKIAKSHNGEQLLLANYGRAEIRNSGSLRIWDASGKEFTMYMFYSLDVSNENVVAMPILLEHLYKGVQLPNIDE